MLDALKRFFLEDAGERDGSDFDVTDKRLAEAALMFHVIAADGDIRDDELARMKTLLGHHFDLGDDETDQLIEEARRADLEAVDLYRFTSVLIRDLEEEERVAIVERLWQIVFADGDVHEVEDNIVWRVAELLGVSARDRMVAKKQVREKEA